jgi:hypothetical protein
MDGFTLDCRELENWDFEAQPPIPLPNGRTPKRLQPREVTGLKSALGLGKSFSPPLATAEELLGIAGGGVPATILVPPGMRLSSKYRVTFSKSPFFTGSGAIAGSANAIAGGVLAGGIYASTTREVGVFVTYGAGLFINTPAASIGQEWTFIKGTPVDFSGIYFGVGLSLTAIPPFFCIGVTVLFSPTFGTPLILTLMGLALDFQASTPTRLPATLAITVTNTKISGIKF